MTDNYWKNEKTRSVATWIMSNLDILNSARNFVRNNSDAPIIYRAWIKAERMHEHKTPEGIEVLDPELHFGQLSEVLNTLRFD